MSEAAPDRPGAQRPRRALLLRVVKAAAAALIAAALLVVGGLGIAVLSFDPNQYKTALIRAVQEREHRTLTLPGTIELKLFPPLTLRTGPFTLSERDGSAVFARADDLRLHLDLFALLRRRLVVDRVVMVRPQLQVRRDAGGRFNFADLMPQRPPESGAAGGQGAGSPLGLSVHRLEIDDGTVAYDDAGRQLRGELTGLTLSASGLDGGTGAVHLLATVRSAQPALATRVELRAELLADAARHRYALRDIAMSVQGEAFGLRAVQSLWSGAAEVSTRPALAASAAGWTVKADARTAAGRLLKFQAALAACGFRGDAVDIGPFQAGVAAAGEPALRATVHTQAATGSWRDLRIPSLQADLQRGDVGSPAETDLALVSPLQLDLTQSRYVLPAFKLSGRIAGPATTKPIAVALQGDAGYSGGADKQADFAFQGQLAGSAVKAAGGWQQGVLKLGATVDRVDLADWMRAAAAASPPASPGNPGNPGNPGKSTPLPPERPIDLSLLKSTAIDAQLKVGSLLFKGMQWSAVQATLNGDRKTFRAAPVKAQGFGGSIDAALDIDLDAQRYHLRQTGRELSVQPILKALWGRDFLVGQGSDRIDVSAQGATWGAMLASLSGSARIDVRNGAVKGFDLPAMLHGARALLASHKDTGFVATAGARTEFSRLGATFALKNGIAGSSDLTLQSTVLRVEGQGRFDLPHGTMDVVLVPSLVGTPRGWGAADLSALRKVSVPVRLSGPFAAPAYTVLWSQAAGGLLRETIRSKLEEELRRRFAPAPGAPAEQRLPQPFRDLLGQ